MIVRRALLISFALLSGTAVAQSPTRFEVDPSWPALLPDRWVTGRLGGVCVDSHDHVLVVNRGDITSEEAETSIQAPPIIMFDQSGKVVSSWSDYKLAPTSIHGCAFDRDNNAWVAGNEDGIIQKYSHDGKLLIQIGTKGVFDTSDGTDKGKALNAAPDKFFLPAGIAVDPQNGDLYVADGYGNRRIAVFNKEGKFLRQWGRQATKEEAQAGVGGVFARIVHCVAIGNDGLVYVCDRQGDRIQVFEKSGKFVRNIWVRTGTADVPDPRGTVWWLEFSRDPQQKLIYVMNGGHEMVDVLDHETGKILNSFGRPGHQVGNFTHGHTLAVDSHGNIYVAETDWGRRIQRFKPVGD